MARETNIEWATATWNPFIGCTKVSPACDNCYAERWAKRCGREFSEVVPSSQSTWNAPLKWKKPERIFVCSLSDFFHPDISDEGRDAACAVMNAAPQHTYMLLTKRPENIKAQLAATGWAKDLPANVWLGVTAENQEQADRRIPLLLEIPARVRFVSCEPLLGPVEIKKYLGYYEKYETFEGGPASPKLSWVICGGESGPHARPMHPAWGRRLRDQCAAAGVPFMFKQWGEWYPDDTGRIYRANMKIFGNASVWRVGKEEAGRTLDGREHLEVPR